MNYRHSFHAGNYADVFKHTMLVQLVRAMQRKEKGFVCIDTHAGRGSYDLSAPADPTRPDRPPEWPEGLGLIADIADAPPAVAEYLELVRAFDRQSGGTGKTIHHYPGSPWLMSMMARPQDRLVLWEQQDSEVQILRRDFEGVKRHTVECGDGYGALRAVLPPLERRALSLIDPPFEEQGEFERIRKSIAQGLKRMPSATHAIWYPVTERAGVEDFITRLLMLEDLPPTLRIEITVTADPQVRMKGSGLMILNPPWQFDQIVSANMPWLVERLARDSGADWHMDWVVPEK